MTVDPAALLTAMRAEVREALDSRAFLRLDRGSALFVSNAPLFQKQFSEIEGFEIRRGENLIFVYPSAERVRTIEKGIGMAEDGLSETLFRFAGQDVPESTRDLFSACLKLKQTCAPDLARADRILRQSAALALRGAIPGGGLFLCARLLHEIGKQYDP